MATSALSSARLTGSFTYRSQSLRSGKKSCSGIRHNHPRRAGTHQSAPLLGSALSRCSLLIWIIYHSWRVHSDRSHNNSSAPTWLRQRLQLLQRRFCDLTSTPPHTRAPQHQRQSCLDSWNQSQSLLLLLRDWPVLVHYQHQT